MGLRENAIDRLKAALMLPVPENADELYNDGERFDPWQFFDGIYGVYSSDFDEMAIAVLCDIYTRQTVSPLTSPNCLASQIFREMFCVVGWCDYGSSPRVCFPSDGFAPLLPDLIKKWQEWYKVQWG